MNILRNLLLLCAVTSSTIAFAQKPKPAKPTPAPSQEKKAEVKPTPNTNTAKKPKNIIFLIGDGMGVSQIYAGITARKDATNFERMKFIGFSKTASYDDYITDSAAGATAFSIGRKTYNGAIGVDKDSIPQETILETAEKNGLATGLVATSTITHATPASFIAHVKSRKAEDDIANYFLETDIDVFIGGGRKHFTIDRKDSKDLLASLRAKNYNVVNTMYEMNYVKTGKLCALLEEDAMAPYWPDSVRSKDTYLGKEIEVKESRGDMLPKSAQKAIDLLKKKKKGFFLMVEGSQIDWGGHANNKAYVVSEMLDFENTLGQVLDWAEKDGNTLVVVTADHETGGMALTDGSLKRGTVEAKFIWKEHTATMVPVFAFGPGADQFQGIYHNTAIYFKMMDLLGLPLPKPNTTPAN